jgi:uncharacterized membrane protein SpoIIM required for sporulation
MVLEALISPLKAEKKPWDTFIIGFVYSAIAIALSLWIFEEQASLVSVFLISIAAIPLIYSTFRIEEEKDITMETERSILKEHSKAIAFLIFLFCGIVLAYVIAYLVLPSPYLKNLFELQHTTITAINSNTSSELAMFSKIFLNNMKVLTFCMVFSLFYGAGAIFILAWNGSVIATAMGNFVRQNLSSYAGTLGFSGIAVYLHTFSLSLLRYSIHGIPEIGAYFVASLAGGIISVAIIRYDFRTKKFEKVIFDASNLILISVVILAISAFLESYVILPIF